MIIPAEDKIIPGTKPFGLTGDAFPKIVVRHDIRKRRYDENGIPHIGIYDFLPDDAVV